VAVAEGVGEGAQRQAGGEGGAESRSVGKYERSGKTAAISVAGAIRSDYN